MKKSPGAIVKRLQLTEKGTLLSERENKYLFKVHPSANKVEIKRAVEELFNVAVDKVNTMNYSGKRKRLRTVRFGRRPDWKRAVVTLSEGSKIDLA
jgi:large subunit ribosomal protein L23